MQSLMLNQPFFTTGPTGKASWLDLSLSYEIVTTPEGDLKIEASAGERTTLVIQLPVKTL